MKRILYLTIFLITAKFTCSMAQQGVGINTTGASANNKAMLDIDVSGITGEKKGLLFPRMIWADRPTGLGVSHRGMMMFVTDGDGLNGPGFYYFDGSSWKYFLASSDIETGFIKNNAGSTQSGARFKIDGNGIFDGGNVVIGSSSSSNGNKLDVWGTIATRSGTHATGRPLYVTGINNDASGGAEFRSDDATQGVGIGRNTIYSAGANADQSLNLKTKGQGNFSVNTNNVDRLVINGSTGETTIGNLSGSGNRIVVADNNGKLVPGGAVGTGITTGTGAAGYPTIWTGTNTLGFDTRYFFDGVNDRLGIGTNVPDQKIEIMGINENDGGVLNLINSDKNQYMQLFGGHNADPNPFIGVRNALPLRFGALSNSNSSGVFTEFARFNGTGNLGIASNNPGEKLDVTGNIRASGFGRFGGGTGVHADRVEVRENLSGSGFAYIDFRGDDTYSDFGLRLLRGNGGANSWSELNHRGTGPLVVQTTDAADIFFKTSNTDRVVIKSGGFVGINSTNPGEMLDVVGNIRVTANTGKLILGADPNWDYLSNQWLGTASSRSFSMEIAGQLDLKAGRDNNADMVFTAGVGSPQRMRIHGTTGNIGMGVGPLTTAGQARLSISRDNAAPCCGGEDATLGLAESTTGTGRRATISFHNGGEAEGMIRLIQNVHRGVSSRRLLIYDNQDQGLGIELESGSRLWYGTNGSRSETRTNAGLMGNAGAQSGFYENDGTNVANFYSGASGWQHLIDVRHSNPDNNYAMQFAGSFFDQRFFARKTNNNASQPWYEIATIGRGNGGMISHVRNEYYGVAGPNNWNAVTGYSPWMRVRNGDQIKLDGMYYGRLTGGSANEFFYTMVEITGQNGCAGQQFSNQHDYWHADEGGGDHDNFKPVPYMDVWNCNCDGEIRFRLWVYVGGDDNWETRENIITGTRY